MRWLAALAVVGLLGCSKSTSDVRPEEGYNLGAYRKIAVPAFVDARGHGGELAQRLRGMLLALPVGVCDEAAVERVLGDSASTESDGTIGLEGLERLRFQAGADAIILGRMAPDWSSASVLLYETDLGDVMLRAVVRPPKKTQKTFATPEEVSAAVVAALTGRK